MTDEVVEMESSFIARDAPIADESQSDSPLKTDDKAVIDYATNPKLTVPRNARVQRLRSLRVPTARSDPGLPHE